MNRFSYAIRNIVAEAKAVEARGTAVRYLNIGDPVAFGFQTPAHLVEAASSAMRERPQRLPGVGRHSRGAHRRGRGLHGARGGHLAGPRAHHRPARPKGIELTLSALADPGDEVLVPSPTYPLYTAVLTKIGAVPRYYRTDPDRDWMPDVDHLRSLVTARTKAIVMIDPNNPTGAVYPSSVRRAIIDVAERHDLTILADEVYGELGYEGPVPLLSTLDPDAPIISFSSLSKAYLAPGWRTGWLVVGATPRLDDALAAIKKMADGRLCSPGPMQHAVAPALRGDRSHQPAFRAALAERARVTTEMLNAIPGMRCVAPRGAFYAMPQVTLPPGRTDEHYVLSLLRETGILCVYGSGFGMAPEMGTFRIVFLAQPSDLRTIYADIGAFTAEYLRT